MLTFVLRLSSINWSNGKSTILAFPIVELLDSSSLFPDLGAFQK